MKKLKYFDLDESRHLLVVPMNFYQIDLSDIVDSFKKNEMDPLREDVGMLPSWKKVCEDPLRAQHFIKRLFSELFVLDDSFGITSCSLDLQTRQVASSALKSAIVFLPHTMKRTNLKEFEKICHSHFPDNYVIVLVSGANGVNNKRVEKLVRDKSEYCKKNNKHLLVIASCLAQRSFSVADLDTVILAYDGGQSGSTLQKIWRATTTGDINKKAKIISLSFDSKRDEKFDAMILNGAVNIQKTHDLNIWDAVREVYSTVSIFRNTPKGSVELKVDEYIKELTLRSRLERVIGTMIDYTQITENQREILLRTSFKPYEVIGAKVVQMGITFESIKKKKNVQVKKISVRDDQKLLRERIVGFCENLKYVVVATDKTSVKDAFEYLKTDDDLRDSIAEAFELPFDDMYELVNCGAINVNLIELNFKK